MPPSRFEPLGKARFHTEFAETGERIVIPARRNWIFLPFISFWLIMWTAGGFAAMTALFTGPDAIFLLVWLAFWALGWASAVTTIGWQIAGKTLLWVENGALVYRWQMPLIGRTKHYDAAQVANLGVTPASLSPFGSSGGRMLGNYPPFFPMRGGTVRFDYGARTVQLALGLDEAEGQLVVDWLAARLPRSAAH